ncbi:TetR/AcrR family transcriptional regulator [Mesobacillus boroniphilus]|uniref:TetR/AcrR family transcriptional regulator n=1 Tax=Mesobacillus boroniphilus TaxID=308892 RepID=A0A944CQJ7_9BACI|nr:TetR-like C-terminal domain-containing protein [Mesobacillus boroniphilus]MBS8266806.1 TetR/AcrR family transcriptional regulator [Mesobacillus boroniphilus]
MSPRPKIALDKNTIVLAAAELANNYGSEYITLASLAKKLNIKPPSLYNHFDGLPGIKRELATFALEKLYNSLEEEAEGKSQGKEAVVALSQAYFTFARRNPGLYEFALSAPDPADERVHDIGNKIVGIVVSAIQPFGLEEKETIHAVRGLRSLMHGFASLEQKGGFGMPLDLDESYQLAVIAFIRGLKK